MEVPPRNSRTRSDGTREDTPAQLDSRTAEPAAVRSRQTAVQIATAQPHDNDRMSYFSGGTQLIPSPIPQSLVASQSSCNNGSFPPRTQGANVSEAAESKHERKASPQSEVGAEPDELRCAHEEGVNGRQSSVQADRQYQEHPQLAPANEGQFMGGQLIKEAVQSGAEKGKSGAGEGAVKEGSTEEGATESSDRHFNNRGYEICGVLNQHRQPCQRIGNCPFHSTVDARPITRKTTRRKHLQKAPYKQGWTKEEHILFLNGLQKYGKGNWKEISSVVGTRTATQIQSHAQKYYLRQKQANRTKRSIHDISLDELTTEEENAHSASVNADGLPSVPYHHKHPEDPMNMWRYPSADGTVPVRPLREGTSGSLQPVLQSGQPNNSHTPNSSHQFSLPPSHEISTPIITDRVGTSEHRQMPPMAVSLGPTFHRRYDMSRGGGWYDSPVPKRPYAALSINHTQPSKHSESHHSFPPSHPSASVSSSEKRRRLQIP